MDNNVAKGVVHYIDGSCLREGFKNKKKIVEFSTKRGGGGQDRPILH